MAAIGINWKEVWDEAVWDAVWANDPPVTVPDVVGQTQASGTTELEGEGFVVAVATAYSSSVAAGVIISQAPIAGAQALPGSTVTITVSLGEAPAQQPGGRGQRRRGRQRFYVEIDGQQFPVDSAQEAADLLQRARALAEQQAEQKVERVTKVLRRKAQIPRVQIAAPDITASPEIQADLAPLIEDIRRLYKRAEETAELRLLMMKRMRDEDDEDDLLLLM